MFMLIILVPWLFLGIIYLCQFLFDKKGDSANNNPQPPAPVTTLAPVSAPAPAISPEIQNLIGVLQNARIYEILGKALTDCVRGEYKFCGLECPSSVQSHLAPYGNRIKWDDKYGFLFVYVFNRSIDSENEMRVNYSDMPIKNTVNWLNLTVGNYIFQHTGEGINLKIVRYGDIRNAKKQKSGKVYLCLSPFGKDINATWMYINIWG